MHHITSGQPLDGSDAMDRFLAAFPQPKVARNSCFPDGEYCIFLADDFSFGTFGHPWQRSVCVFGAALLEQVEQYLRDAMPLVRESKQTENGG